MTCPWYRRWWHRRAREADRVFMLETICSLTPEVDKRFRMWRVFTEMPGQEHWHCPCSEQDQSVRLTTALRETEPAHEQ